MSVNTLIRLENAVVLISAVFFYQHINAGWILFAILFLSPDLSMIGYFLGTRIGAITYNAIHSYILALLLILIGFTSPYPILLKLGLILSAHIGFDRLLGFGIKYQTAFKETHIQKI